MVMSSVNVLSAPPECVNSPEAEPDSDLYGTLFHLASGIVVNGSRDDQDDGIASPAGPDRRLRADAQRNAERLIRSAAVVFAKSGVDAPVRDIAENAGVGVGTLYRHFPHRADLIAAVFRHEVDACADAAPILAARHEPFEALAQWLQRYAAFIAAKRGLAKALYSGDAAFETLPAYFDQRLRPALQTLLVAAAAAGQARRDVDADDILGAVASLCMSAYNDRPGQTQRMVALLVDGLRYGSSLISTRSA
jgi:AcrR family transcriptional regulator